MKHSQRCPPRRQQYRSEMRSPGRTVEGGGICYPTGKNPARTHMLLSSHKLSPISLHSFLPSLAVHSSWDSMTFHPSVILLLGSASKMRITGWSKEEVVRSLPFCMRQKANRKEGIQTKSNEHQRYIRCTNSGNISILLKLYQIKGAKGRMRWS